MVGFQLILIPGKMKTILFLTVFFIGKSAAKLPLNEMIPICNVKNPKLNECVVKSANLLVPYLSKGIKSYGFPPLDPLKVPRMNVGQNNGPINLKLELINTTHLGLSTLKFHSASIDTKKNVWVLNGTLPYYSLSGKYKGNGRILLVPLVGDGKANFTFYNTGIDFVINGTTKKEKLGVYFDVTDLKTYFKFDKSHVVLTNLFNGNKILGERTSRFINDNSDELVNGIKSTLEDVYSTLYTNLVKRIFSNVPYNQMLSSDF